MKWSIDKEYEYSTLSIDTDGGTTIHAAVSYNGDDKLDTHIDIFLPLIVDNKKNNKVCRKRCEMIIDCIKKLEQEWKEQDK